MYLVILIGPHAVGKMTVGQVLSATTGLRLLHNHMTIELVRNFFSVHDSAEGSRLNTLFREEIFKAVAQSDLPGLIFTYMYDFDAPSDQAYIQNLLTLFRNNGAMNCVVELYAELDVRLERNKTENRLQHKPSKRDLAHSEKLFRELEAQHRLSSREGETPFENYLKIDNTHIPPHIAANIICETFEIPRAGSMAAKPMGA